MGRQKFKPCIEKYSLLKNLPQELLTNPRDQIGLYSKEAY